MMKIVQITTDNREHFKDYGAPQPYFGAAPEALLEGFSGLPDLEVHVVSCLRKAVESPLKVAENIYFHPLVVPQWGWMPSFYCGCVQAVRKLLKDLKPDIVHGQGTERGCATMAVHSGYKNVLTLHGNMRELQRLGLQRKPFFGALAAMLETHALKYTTGVFCNSLYTKKLVAPKAKRTWLVPNAIRATFFAEQRNNSRAYGVPQILNIGLVCQRKRQLEILREMGKLARAGYAFRLVFVGDLSERTPYGQQFVRELREAESSGYAAYAGSLGGKDLVSLMDQSQGLIHFPSEEAFGLVAGEALARGLKFFGANLGGIPDIVKGVAGAELYNDFPSLIKGVSPWLKAGAPVLSNASQVICKRYHPREIAKRHIEIYREVLDL